MDYNKLKPDAEDDFTALERRLVAWRPAAGALDRDRMLFDAGRAAGRADDRHRFWRLATAACILVTVALGGLFAHERSQRLALESTTADRTVLRYLQPSTPISLHLARIETAGPNSYFALTSRLITGGRDLSTPEIELELQPARPAIDSSTSSPYSEPLRPRDLQRVLDL